MSGVVTITTSSGAQVLPVSQGKGTAGIVLSGMGVVGFPASGALYDYTGFCGSPVPSPIASNAICCQRCQKDVGYVERRVYVFGVSGVVWPFGNFCWECAGVKFDGDTQRPYFEQREDWIRDTVPDYLQQAPSQIIADYLQDQSRYKDSEYMRNLKSMSGG